MAKREKTPDSESFKQPVPPELLDSYIEAMMAAERIRALEWWLARTALGRVPEPVINTALWHHRTEPVRKLTTACRAVMTELMMPGMTSALQTVRVLYTDLFSLFAPEQIHRARKHRCPDLLEAPLSGSLLSAIQAGEVAVIARPGFPRKYILTLAGHDKNRVVSLDAKTEAMTIVRPAESDIFVTVPLLPPPSRRVR